ncbi:MAG: nucleoside-triphosphatase [Planctomycetota bacterium]
MVMPPTELILWVGAKHSGKTTAARRLADLARARGFRVAGLLAPAVYDADELAGFDLLDPATGARWPLARRDGPGVTRAGDFAFDADALDRGRAALTSAAARQADLVIVDEFGALELRGDGWRPAVDALLRSAEGVLLLIVRRRLAGTVEELYATWRPHVIPLSEGDPVGSVLDLVRRRAEEKQA